MKGVSKQRALAVLISIIATLCGGLAVVISSTLLRNWIIIAYGVRALSKVQIAGGCLCVCGLVLTAVCTLPMVKAAHKKQAQIEQNIRSAEDRSRVLANYANDSTNPDFTRRRLEQLRNEVPELDDLVMQCLDQMDTMDRLQDKQTALIEANDALYLKNTVSVLDNVERRICQNFRNIVNICIASESADALDSAKIDKYLKDNRKRLSDTRELLKASADWINQYNAGEDSDRREVERWITEIRNSLREE